MSQVGRIVVWGLLVLILGGCRRGDPQEAERERQRKEQEARKAEVQKLEQRAFREAGAISKRRTDCYTKLRATFLRVVGDDLGNFGRRPALKKQEAVGGPLGRRVRTRPAEPG